MSSKTRTVIEFQDDIRCSKCGHGANDGDEFSPSFCTGDEESKCDGPKVPHVHIGCSRCIYSWIMLAANDDIEQEFDDLDKFTERCPMCHVVKPEVAYCETPGTTKKCDVIKRKLEVTREHLHNTCSFCDYVWVSDVKDYKPKEEAPIQQPA